MVLYHYRTITIALGPQASSHLLSPAGHLPMRVMSIVRRGRQDACGPGGLANSVGAAFPDKNYFAAQLFGNRVNDGLVGNQRAILF